MCNTVTIKVEPTVRTDDYNKKNNTLNDGYEFIVKAEDTQYMRILIAKLHEHYHLPCARVYPINFKNDSRDRVLTEKEIIEKIKDIATNLGTIIPENVKRMIK